MTARRFRPTDARISISFPSAMAAESCSIMPLTGSCCPAGFLSLPPHEKTGSWPPHEVERHTVVSDNIQDLQHDHSICLHSVFHDPGLINLYFSLAVTELEDFPWVSFT